MKLFMATLEDKARVWYEGLREGSLCSLKYFQNVFSNHYVNSYLSLQSFCAHN